MNNPTEAFIREKKRSFCKSHLLIVFIQIEKELEKRNSLRGGVFRQEKDAICYTGISM